LSVKPAGDLGKRRLHPASPSVQLAGYSYTSSRDGYRYFRLTPRIRLTSTRRAFAGLNRLMSLHPRHHWGNDGQYFHDMVLARDTVVPRGAWVFIASECCLRHVF